MFSLVVQVVVVVQTAVGNYITSGGVILRILDLTDHLLGLFKLELGHRTSGKHRDIHRIHLLYFRSQVEMICGTFGDHRVSIHLKTALNSFHIGLVGMLLLIKLLQTHPN